MNQKVAFDSTTDISLDDAKTAAQVEFPTLNLNGIVDKISLERVLRESELLLFVDVDQDVQTNAALQSEKDLSAQIKEASSTIECPIDPPPFSSQDLDADMCEVPAEFPPAIPIDDNEISQFEAEIQSILDNQHGSVEGNTDTNDEVKQIMDCVSMMQDITDRVNILLKKENDLRNTLVNLEELLYNYRVMESYFKKRIEVLGAVLGTFDPLIVQKRDIENQLGIVTPKRDLKQTDLTTAKTATVKDLNLINTLQADFNALDAQVTALTSDLAGVNQTITLDKNNIPSFSDLQLINGTDAERKTFLEDRINTLFTGSGNTIYTRISQFSTRCNLIPLSNTNPGESFALTIKHDFIDVQNILAGKPKTYLTNESFVDLQPNGVGVTPHGVLYDSLYNIWGIVEQFFTRGERGLTADSNLVEPALKNTGAETFGDSFIQSTDVMQDFYENFAAKHKDKVTYVKNTTIEPTIQNLVFDLEVFATREVQYLLAYGRAFENLPPEDTKLQSVIQILHLTSDKFLARTNELRLDLAFVDAAHEQILKDIETERGNYLKTPCASTPPTPDSEPVPPGSDPIGALLQTDPTHPNPTKFCYWVRFAKNATAVNILPIPGAGGFRYWPIGMLIPTPTGLIKIPLPIVWIPVAVIPLPIGIFVIFIGLCGICPSPNVLFIGGQGEKKFIISLRPGQDFGANASESVIKTVDKGGVGVQKKVNDMLNDINVPGFKPNNNPDASSSLLEDLKDKILKKVQKLGLPDIKPIQQLNIGSSIPDKRAALLETVSKHVNKMVVPDLKFPKNGSTVNPKPPPVLEVVDQMKKLFKLDLPEIAIPSTSKISLKSMLIAQVQKLTPHEVGNVNVQAPSASDTPDVANTKVNGIKTALKKIAGAASAKMTPEKFGILAQAELGITFINPYKCGPVVKGITVPPVPMAIIAGLVAIKIASDALIDGMTGPQISSFLKGMVSFNSSNITAVLTNTLQALPLFEVPNPSKVSIKDMMKGSALKLAKIQLPSLPDVTAGIQPRISIPGVGVKAALTGGISATVNAFPLQGVNLSQMSAVDVKQMIVSIVENSFTPLESFLNPFLNIVSAYKSAKDKTFPEILGLGKVSKDDSIVTTVSKPAMDQALKLVETIALIPYPAVLLAPDIFNWRLGTPGHQIGHPVLTSDDIPPWERLSLKNFLYVLFLDEFCKQGKKCSGFFELP